MSSFKKKNQKNQKFKSRLTSKNIKGETMGKQRERQETESSPGFRDGRRERNAISFSIRDVKYYLARRKRFSLQANVVPRVCWHCSLSCRAWAASCSFCHASATLVSVWISDMRIMGLWKGKRRGNRAQQKRRHLNWVSGHRNSAPSLPALVFERPGAALTRAGISLFLSESSVD